MAPDDLELLGLALAAIDSADARIVLADAIEESGWDDTLAKHVASIFELPGSRFRGLPQMANGCRAIAAVLLFGDWSETMWPVATRCRIYPMALVLHAPPLRRLRLVFDDTRRAMTVAPVDPETRFWLTRVHADAREVLDALDGILGGADTSDSLALAAVMAQRLRDRFPDERIEVICGR